MVWDNFNRYMQTSTTTRHRKKTYSEYRNKGARASPACFTSKIPQHITTSTLNTAESIPFWSIPVQHTFALYEVQTELNRFLTYGSSHTQAQTQPIKNYTFHLEPLPISGIYVPISVLSNGYKARWTQSPCSFSVWSTWNCTNSPPRLHCMRRNVERTKLDRNTEKKNAGPSKMNFNGSVNKIFVLSINDF